MNRIDIQFPQLHQSHSARKGESLLAVCLRVGLLSEAPCGGNGICGKCAVILESAGKRRRVLTCQEIVREPVSVFLPEESGSVFAPEGSSEDHKSDRDNIRKNKPETPSPVSVFYPSVMKRYDNEKDQTVVSFIPDEGAEYRMAVEPKDTTGRLYGLAVDLGTTSVAVFLCDLKKGVFVDGTSATNRQVVFGADVLSRIQKAQRSREELLELKEALRRTLQEAADTLLSANNITPADVYHLILCGNSTMQHLFFGWNPEGLGRSPFTNVHPDWVRSTADKEEISFMNRCGIVEFLPLLSGYVGADTTAGLSVLNDAHHGLQKAEKISPQGNTAAFLKGGKENAGSILGEDPGPDLFIDLGTNGEIALGKNGTWTVASTACGPALEGGSLSCGMRAGPGAIDRAGFRNGMVDLHVIGNAYPRGICGSAVIDLIAALRKEDMIDDTGRLKSPAEIRKGKPDTPLASRIRRAGDEWAFFLVEGKNPVYVTQHDIRQIQLAKAAIRAGMEAMLAHKGLTWKQIRHLYLAGAFGTKLNTEHAVSIGLLADIDRAKIVSLGNAAGRGSVELLFDRRKRKDIDQIKNNASFFNLAEDDFFKKTFLQEINFPD